MTSTEPRPDVFDRAFDDLATEPELLAAARSGSTAAFGILYARHRDHAVSVATAALPRADSSLAEDVVEVAFIRVLTALRNGKGPTDTLRYYLATTVKREAWRTQRRVRRQAEVFDRWATTEPAVATQESMPAGAEDEVGADPDSHVLLGSAYRSLSDRWRHVLWLAEVEGRKPAEIASLLGVSAGTASALIYRARRGLVSAYVGIYGTTAVDDACRDISQRLGAYLAAGAPDRGFDDVVAHLRECTACGDVRRGADVVGESLPALVPFGFLTTGLWAKAAGAGVGKAVVAAGTATGVAVAANGAAGTGAGLGGAATVAAVSVAVAAVVAGSVFGFTRFLDRASSGSSPAAASGSAPDDAPLDRPSVQRPRGSVPTTSAGQVAAVTTDAVVPPGADPSPRPADPAVPVTSSPPATDPNRPTPTDPAPPSTSSPTPSTEPTSPTTSVPAVAPTGRALKGGAVRPHDEIDGAFVPVEGVSIAVFDSEAKQVWSQVTGSDGRWMAKDLPPGRYLVVALVPARYRPADGPDPWSSGDTWTTAIGRIELRDHDLDLVDLRLLER